MHKLKEFQRIEIQRDVTRKRMRFRINGVVMCFFDRPEKVMREVWDFETRFRDNGVKFEVIAPVEYHAYTSGFREVH